MHASQKKLKRCVVNEPFSNNKTYDETKLKQLECHELQIVNKVRGH
jgi:hypothetical protein